MNSLQVATPSFPAKGSPQVAGVRSKVALKPGRSLMDWIRLGNTAKDLSGTGGKVLQVTPEELAKHNKVKDCWMAIRGMVFNVTPYMEFHPGGEEEMMRGAGIDGTALFDEVHKWVNVESMLEKCFVGKLVGDDKTSKGGSVKSSSSSSSLRTFHLTPLTNGTASASADVTPTPPAFVAPSSPSKPIPRYEWFQSDKTVTIEIYTKWKQVRHENVMIDRTDDALLLTLLLNKFTYHVHIKLQGAVTNDYTVNLPGSVGRVEVVLQKCTAGQWTGLGLPLQKNDSYRKTADTEIRYRSCRIASVEKVTHDTNLYSVDLPEGCRVCVPLGHHVYVRATVEGMEVSRSYTVVPPSLSADHPDPALREGRRLYLMIKIYQFYGALTPIIGKLKPGDALELSGPEGDFAEARLRDCRELVMFAAGTGFTPMAALIHAAYSSHYMEQRKVHLIFFNKTERDILWRSQLEKLKESQPSLQVTHVLSLADEEWAGLQGRIRAELVALFLPKPSNAEGLLVCACGPTPFTNEAVRLAVSHGIKEEQIHSFLG